ncbi:MAG: histidine--tRNA ligase [Candidatus Gracilibacteria bacterium]
MNQALITPEIPKGTRDFLPADMAKRIYVMEKIKNTFVNFGYDTIETPVIEYAKTLLGKYGDEGNKQIYSFDDNGGRKIALRFDQTVPFARLVASNYQNLPMPFKRYQISRVWRADKPAKGRYREFYQCDIDIIGTKNLLSEAEITRVIYSTFNALAFEKFIIKFNSRRLINDIFASLGISKDKFTDVLRILDKLGKIGEKATENELGKLLPKQSVEDLLRILNIKGSNQEKLKSIESYASKETIEEVKEYLDLCDSFGVPEKNLILDISLARGLDYYTGIVFEVYLTDIEIGAVCAGGRYDNLCSLFSDKEFSGVGVAFGFDRIVLAMEELGMLKQIKLNAEVLVTYFDKESLNESIKIAKELQEAGINTEIYFEPASLGKQMKYADKKGIQFVVICGPEEIKKNEANVKIMQIGKQKSIPRTQLVSYLTGFKKIGKIHV